MRWLRPEPTRPYQISEDGKWIVNRVSVCGVVSYALVRLGKPDRGAWIGSEIVKVGSKAECEEAADEHHHRG